MEELALDMLQKLLNQLLSQEYRHLIWIWLQEEAEQRWGRDNKIIAIKNSLTRLQARKMYILRSVHPTIINTGCFHTILIPVLMPTFYFPGVHLWVKLIPFAISRAESWVLCSVTIPVILSLVSNSVSPMIKTDSYHNSLEIEIVVETDDVLSIIQTNMILTLKKLKKNLNLNLSWKRKLQKALSVVQ